MPQIEKCPKSLITVFIIDGVSMTNKIHFKKITLINSFSTNVTPVGIVVEHWLKKVD